MEKYKIYDKEYNIIGYKNVVDENKNIVGRVPIVDIPQISDYEWQLNCLNDRLQHPEKYEDIENVEETIAKLRKWLAEREAVAV